MLDAKDNLICHIESNAFAGLSKLQVIHLENNDLKEISAISAPYLQYAYLDGNLNMHQTKSLVSLQTIKAQR